MSVIGGLSRLCFSTLSDATLSAANVRWDLIVE